MAKFTTKNIEFKDDQKAIFGTGDDSAIYWDGTLSDMRITTTISGVTPTQGYHLTTKQYVDQQIGGIDEFIELTDTPSTYVSSKDKMVLVKSDESGLEFTDTASGVFYGTFSGTFYGGDGVEIIHVTHSNLDGLLEDDHPQYTLVNGLRAFTSTVSGVDPTENAHLATKYYVDQQIISNDEFLELTDTPAVYSGSEDKYVRVKPDGTGLIFAPAIVGTTSTGTIPPEDSNLWYNQTLNEFFFYDPVRGNWLSLTVHNYLYTRQGNVDGLYLSVGDLIHAEAHYFIPRAATITAIISSSEQVFNSSKGFEIRSAISGTIYSFSQTAWEYNNMSSNILVEEDDQLRVFATSAGDRCRNPAVTLEVRWRFVP